MKKSIVVVAMAVLVIMGLGAAAGAVTGATDLANKRDIALNKEITFENYKTNNASLNHSVTVPDLADTNYLQRGNIHINKGIIDNKLIEIKVGDIYTTTGSHFVKPDQAKGATLSRKYNIDPMINPYNSLDQRLTLTAKSRVEFYRNGRLVATQELDPGIYDLRNLPVARFSGDLKIKIVDVCATGQGTENSVCEIGEPLSPGQGYVVGSGFVETNNTKVRTISNKDNKKE